MITHKYDVVFSPQFLWTLPGHIPKALPTHEDEPPLPKVRAEKLSWYYCQKIQHQTQGFRLLLLFLPLFLPSPPLPSTGVPCTGTPLRAPRFVQEPTQPDGETARQPHCLASLAFKLSKGKLFSHLEEVFTKSRGTSHGWCQSKFNLLAGHPATFPCNLVTKSVSVSSCPSSHSCWTPY